MTPSLAVYLFTYNTEKIRYPWCESIRAALALAGSAGAVFLNECNSTDGTAELVPQLFEQEIFDGHLRLSHWPWGTQAHVQVEIANHLLAAIGDEFDYALKLDADEVPCEWTFEALYDDLYQMEVNGYKLGKPRYVHFCPDDRTTFPFIYDSKAVILRTASALRFEDADACALGGNGVAEFQTRLRIHHYGKLSLGREREALVKEREFTAMYGEAFGFPDPKVKAQWRQGWLDYLRVFEEASRRGDFKPYIGRHPVFMADYLRQAWVRHNIFVRELSDAV